MKRVLIGLVSLLFLTGCNINLIFDNGAMNRAGRLVEISKAMDSGKDYYSLVEREAVRQETLGYVDEVREIREAYGFE